MSAHRTVPAPAATATLDPEPEFAFDAVTKVFTTRQGEADFVAVSDLSLAVPAGTFVSIIGPSGCGKSTLLNLASGLMAPTSGRVLQRGRPICGPNPDVGYMTQHNNLLPWRTVERNVGLALETQGVRRAERRERVAAMLDLVGLTGFGDRFPSQLSGGMLKRTALARTLIYEPRTLLMDEPFGALDAQLRMGLQRELLTVWERDRKTVFFVTHDLEEAILLSDLVVVFGKDPGRIIHLEPIGFERPRDLVELRTDTHFTEVWERLWRLLEQQIGDEHG